MTQQKSLFDNAEVIFSYTDDQAVDDGILVAINEKGDRVTNSVYFWLSEAMQEQDKPPSNWPIDLMDFCSAHKNKNAEARGNIRALAMCRALIDVERKQATRVYNENIGGGIFVMLVECDAQDRPTALREATGKEGKTLWLIPNENDGITLMFPSDY